MDVPKNIASERDGFGDEIYETETFQEKVKNIYRQLQDDSYWQVGN